MMTYFYLLAMISFSIMAQLLMKWRVGKYSDQIPIDFFKKFFFMGRLFLDPYMFLAYFLGFLSSLLWLLVISRLALGYAYSFTSLTFIGILFFSAYFFHEKLTVYNIIGTLLIVVGLCIVVQGVVRN